MDIRARVLRWLMKILGDEPSTCKHEWLVYCVVLQDEFIQVQCPKCFIFGAVKEPTEYEWNKALDAPSNPYLWEDNTRVTVLSGTDTSPRTGMSKTEWRSLLDSVKSYCEGYSVFLETRKHGMISIDDPATEHPKSDVIAVAITAAGEGVGHLESEQRARTLRDLLNETLDRECILLLNRDPDAFVGYYVRVR